MSRIDYCGDCIRAFVTTSVVSVFVVLGVNAMDGVMTGLSCFGAEGRAGISVAISSVLGLLTPWLYSVLADRRHFLFADRMRLRAVWRGRFFGLMVGVWIGLYVAPAVFPPGQTHTAAMAGQQDRWQRACKW